MNRISGVRVIGRAIASLLFGLTASSAIVVSAADDLPELFWGDTHVHTSNSLDANLFNNFNLGPDVAYRFARGERIYPRAGVGAQLRRPLDFLVVSDHAEYMGVFSMIRNGHPAVADSGTAEVVKQLMDDNPIFGPEDITTLNGLLQDDPLASDEKLQRIVWDEAIDIAERHNAPGRFTTIVGYEWGSTPGGNNLHRNVVFRDGPDRTKQILPFSAVHSDRPEKLWAFLEDYEEKTGGQAFAIPHNPNLSNGLMFAVEDSDGEPIDADYARMRSRFEPVLEVTQIKGDSETHPFLSPDDEFADYESWDKTNIFGLARTEPEMHVGSYARAALKTGLLIQSRIGLNPFRFGLIGSTDAHTSLATADEENFWGKTANMPPGSDRMLGEFIRPRIPDAEPTMNWEQAASGYAGVWAEANTREAIFDAMRRGEAFATTGPRINVRFFGGWRFSEIDVRSSSPARAGYVKGVPMGGDLPRRVGDPTGPTFMALVAQDPQSARIQRIQMVKGWVDADGKAHESVTDVKVADSPVTGAAEMSVVWKDTDFDPEALCFYYLRVLEVPTPRWNAIDAARYGKPKAGMRVQHQERAYTSPIWYTPASLPVPAAPTIEAPARAVPSERSSS